MTVPSLPSFLKSRKAGLGTAAVAVILLVSALAIPHHSQHPSSSTPVEQPQASSGYVDPSICASCHQNVVETFRKTGMGRSFSIPSTKNVMEDYKHLNTVENKASGLHYRMIQRNGEFFQRRFEIGFDGKETNAVEMKVDYVLGSGNHARNYLHRNRQGQLIELPVSWYSEKTGYWAMSPGYDRKDQEDFRRVVAPGCVFCHNAYPQMQATNANADSDEAIFPQKLPEGIDCQRCHGPGARHVAAVRSEQPSIEKIRSTIVNPARLGRERQLEVCMQCHLETSSRHIPNELRIYDRGVFSYRPGEPLGDFKLYFDRSSASGSNDTFEIAHAAYRLRESACFRNSQMTCLTCHDPHDISHGKQALPRYIQICQSCHQKVKHTVALPSASNCISCHMPKRRAEDAVHVVMTDHLIRSEQPGRDLLAPLKEEIDPDDGQGETILYYPAKAPDTAAGQLTLRMALVRGNPNPESLSQLETAIVHYAPADPKPYVALGRAYAKAGNNAKAILWFDRALAKRPNYIPAVEQLVLALNATDQSVRATEILQQAIAVSPDDDLLLTNLGNTYLRQGKLTEAQEMLQRAIAVHPGLAQAHNLLGLVALQKNDASAAEASFRNAILAQPDLAEARNNLATLLTGKHEYAAAAFNYQKAIAANPSYADAHHGYGLLLVLENKYPEAIAELKEAEKLASNDPQIHGDLADVLSAQKQFSEAIFEYQQVLRLRPAQADAQLGLGIALLQEGNMTEARQYLMSAAQSNDPAIVEAAQQTLRQVVR